MSYGAITVWAVKFEKCRSDLADCLAGLAAGVPGAAGAAVRQR